MDVDSSSNPSSSQPNSPVTRSSTTLARNLDPDPEKIASLTQKLYESLKTLKSSKNKTSVAIPLVEFENILSRAQQVALLTSASSASRPCRDETGALSSQISDMSDRISGQLTDLESRLVQSSRIAVDTAPIPNPILPPPDTSVLEGIRHSSLYLADGNLVMAAPVSEAGGGTMLFRVHKSMLSLQSPVFASMFTLPHPEMNPDIYDGAPFVRMPDDAKDIESLLKVLYDPSELPYKRLDPLTPITVRRPLTMAIKYEMEHLRDRIIAQLQADWPNLLAEWDRLETEAHALWIEHASAAATDFKIASLSLDDRLPEPAAAIRLAADCNIPKIMPAAVYHLSRLETDQDWLESHKETSDANYDCNRTARWDLLEAADLKLVLKLRETIKDFQFKGLYVSAGKSCLALERCVDVWGEHCLRWAHEADPLSLMKSFREARPARGICKSCWLKTRDNVRDARVDLWEEICECIGDA